MAVIMDNHAMYDRFSFSCFPSSNHAYMDITADILKRACSTTLFTMDDIINIDTTTFHHKLNFFCYRRALRVSPTIPLTFFSCRSPLLFNVSPSFLLSRPRPASSYFLSHLFHFSRCLNVPYIQPIHSTHQTRSNVSNMSSTSQDPFEIFK